MAAGGITSSDVLLDTNVFFSRTLRDWISMLYLNGPDGWFNVFWTEDIMAELVRSLRRKMPFGDEVQVCGVRDRLAETFSRGRIQGYEVDGAVNYPDVFDAHVHAAAVHAGVDFVVTADLDFEKLGDEVDELPYEIHSPDTFLCLLNDHSPSAVKAVTRMQVDYWRTRKETFNLAAQLQRAGAPAFAEQVRHHLQTVM